MRIRIFAALLAVLALAIIAAPAQAGHGRTLDRKANALRTQVVKRFGADAAGRDIIRQGVRTKHGSKAASRSLKLRYVDVLDRTLHPPPPPAPVTYLNSAPPATTAAASGGSGGLPACASESGTNYSMGPDNTNPSGASGRYQIMPFHWSTDCAGIAQDPGGQDKCAAIIYANSGSGAWTGCG